jgi:chaperonin GroES
LVEQIESMNGRSRRAASHEPRRREAKEGESAMVKIRPLGDRVLVEPLELKEVSKGGIIIPDTAKEKPQEGKVIAIGTGKRDDDGKLIPFNVKKGDRILMPKYGGTEVKIDDKEYQIIREDDILAVLED